MVTVRAGDGQHRAALRDDLLPLLAAFVVVVIVIFPARAIGARLAEQAGPTLFGTQAATRYAVIVGAQLGEVALALAGLALLFRLTRRGSFAQLGLSGAGSRALPAGLLLSTLAVVAALLIVIAAGGLRPERIQFAGVWPTLLAFGAALRAAVIEELLFRSILLRGAARLTNGRAAVGITAALFTALHLLAPFRLTLAWWIVVVVAGLGLGWLCLATRGNLWWPIGLHLGFVFAVFMLFGLPGETRGAVLWETMTAAPALSAAAGWVLLIAAALLTLWGVVFVRGGGPKRS